MTPRSGPHLSSLRDLRSDEELVHVCNTGTAAEAAAAFELLYRRHRDFVYRIAMRYVGDRDVALDVLQETFTYLLRKFPPNGEGLTLTARLETLLYPAAKHRSLDWLRRHRREVPLLWDEARPNERATSPSPDEEATAAALTAADQGDGDAFAGTDAVAAAIARLSPERREALTLRFVDGLSLAEIATALDVPLGTVKSRLSLGVKQLREYASVRALFDP